MQRPPKEVMLRTGKTAFGGRCKAGHIKYTLKRINLVWKLYLDLLCLIHIVLRTICKKGKAYPALQLQRSCKAGRLRNLKFVSIFVFFYFIENTFLYTLTLYIIPPCEAPPVPFFGFPLCAVRSKTKALQTPCFARNLRRRYGAPTDKGGTEVGFPTLLCRVGHGKQVLFR